MKSEGSLARNIDFAVANFQVHEKTRRKTAILQLQSVKIGGSLARNAPAKPVLFEGIKAGCNVVLRGRSGTS